VQLLYLVGTSHPAQTLPEGAGKKLGIVRRDKIHHHDDTVLREILRIKDATRDQLVMLLWIFMVLLREVDPMTISPHLQVPEAKDCLTETTIERPRLID